jgi:hypothetical protein
LRIRKIATIAAIDQPITFLDMPHSAKAILVALPVLMTDSLGNSQAAPQSMAPRC